MSSNSFKVNLIQKFSILCLNMANVFMFLIFSKKTWMAFFNKSALRFLIYPLITVSSIINAVIESWRYYNEVNKNITNTATLMLILSFTIGGTIANLGNVITAIFLHSPFQLGAYFIMGAMAIGCVFNLSKIGIHLHQYLKAPSLSKQKNSHKQSLALHIFGLLMCASVFAGLFFSAVIPAMTIAPYVAVFFFIVDTIWSSLLSDENKKDIKQWFGFTEPLIDMEVNHIAKQHSSAKNNNPKAITLPPKTSTLSFFSPAYRKEHVHQLLCANHQEAAKSYLLKELTNKIASINVALEKHKDLKHQHKLLILTQTKELLVQDKNISTNELDDLFKIHFLAKQSFWSIHFGDVEDLMQAVALYAREACEIDNDKINTPNITK